MKVQLTLNPEYAIRWVAVSLLMIAISIWSVYDGIISYPRMNRQLSSVAQYIAEPGMTPTRLLEIEGRQRRIDAIYTKQLNIRKAPRRLVGKVKDLAKQAMKAQDSVKPGHNSDFVLEQNKQLRELVCNTPLWSEHDIRSQFVMAVLTLVLGIAAALTLLYRRIKAGCLDGDTFRGFGAPFDMNDITSVDDSSWKGKGILRLHIKDGRQIVLDAWHYNGVKDIKRHINL